MNIVISRSFAPHRRYAHFANAKHVLTVFLMGEAVFFLSTLRLGVFDIFCHQINFSYGFSFGSKGTYLGSYLLGHQSIKYVTCLGNSCNHSTEILTRTEISKIITSPRTLCLGFPIHPGTKPYVFWWAFRKSLDPPQAQSVIN